MTYICEKCGKRHDGKFGSGRFCSRSCANSRTVSPETKAKISKSVKKWHKTHTKTDAYIESLKKSAYKALKKWKEVSVKRLMEADFSSLKWESLRKRVILEQDGKCNKCGIHEWNGKPITLELEHKNGNRDDNSRENLEALCPNCHSQTPTWRGKNRRNNKNTVTDDMIVKAFIKTGNIRQTLIMVGLSPKGANYGRVKRALTVRGIRYET